MIVSRTPLRVSFFGGGTDFRDFYKEHEGCVLSTAIDQYIYVMINKRFDTKIQLNYRITEIVDSVDEIIHPTIREAMRFVDAGNALELSNMADVHALGTGLGSSSSFLVGMLNALGTYAGKIPTPEQLAKDACKIEIETLREPIGKQDQYIAAYGGVRFITFKKDDSVVAEEVAVKPQTMERLQKKLLFFYTGLSRRSSSVLKGQKENIKDKTQTLVEMKNLAKKMRDSLVHGRVEEFGDAFHTSWEMKRSLASGVSNELIDNLYSNARSAGAQGGKVLGAGGGGFLMLYCDEEKQGAVRKALSTLREVHFKFPRPGSQIVFNDTDSK